MEQVFFDSWQSIARSFIITVLAYLVLIFMLRVSGKRTLSKMNAFDFIVTIALGSCLATVALNKNVALVDGALVFFLLIFMQYIITTLSVKFKKVKRAVTAKPSLLLYRGEVLENVLEKERITIEEVYLAARQQGIGNLQEIDIMILESAGDITIIPSIETDRPGVTEDVQNMPDNN